MLDELENRLEGDRKKLCALLGIHEQTYYKYRQGREVPTYILHSVWSHMQLSDTALKRRVKSCVIRASFN